MVGQVSTKSRPHAGAGFPWRKPSRVSGAVRSYVYGSYVDELLAILPASGVVGERKFVHANHLYSVAALTDNSGAVVERYRYDAYGQRIVLAGDGVTLRWGSSYGNQVGFTGRYLDKETGLWYFRARYYSGSLGRFVSRDPLTYVDGMSLYTAYYVPNALDPSGLCSEYDDYVCEYSCEKCKEGEKKRSCTKYSDLKSNWVRVQGGAIGEQHVRALTETLLNAANHAGLSRLLGRLGGLTDNVADWYVVHSWTEKYKECVCGSGGSWSGPTEKTEFKTQGPDKLDDENGNSHFTPGEINMPADGRASNHPHPKTGQGCCQ